MIDRLSALADIVGPRPVPAPPASAWWHGATLELLLGAALAVACVLALRGARGLRTTLARRRLRKLADTLRAGPPDRAVDALMPDLRGELRRAGIGLDPHVDLRGATSRACIEQLLYAPIARADVLCALLDPLVRR